MKNLLHALFILIFSLSFLATPPRLFAQASTPSESVEQEEPGFVQALSGGIALQLTGCSKGKGCDIPDLEKGAPQNLLKYMAGGKDKNGNKAGLIPQGGQIIAMMYQEDVMPSSREYFANLLDNMGLPSAKQAYAQGTGYTAMSPFLPMWQAFRNLAYAVYIIMFVVIGIMIMFRTKVGGQTIVSIQSAIPNLLITLILITFSYAIVGFMIDLMYFLIYFVVFLVASTGLVDEPTKLITRLMSYSAWSVIFEGRNSIISAVSLAIGESLSGLGTGALEMIGTLASWAGFMYLIVAVTFAIAMLKLMFALIKSYVMLIVQTVTAPVQIMLNAMPGSKSFSTWLKTTASYLIPFPVAGAMFIFAAIFIGDPSKSVLIEWGGDTNPFGINSNHAFYKDYYSGQLGDDKGTIWLPPFTLTGSVDIVGPDIMRLIGFFILLMTPAAVKMAQDWLQVKESPYSSEAFGTLGMGVTAGTMLPKWAWHQQQHHMDMEKQAKLFRGETGGARTQTPDMPGGAPRG